MKRYIQQLRPIYLNIGDWVIDVNEPDIVRKVVDIDTVHNQSGDVYYAIKFADGSSGNYDYSDRFILSNEPELETEAEPESNFEMEPAEYTIYEAGTFYAYRAKYLIDSRRLEYRYESDATKYTKSEAESIINRRKDGDNLIVRNIHTR